MLICFLDINLSDNNNWIMINASRGTHNLFAIDPFRGSVNFQSADALVLQPKMAFWVLWLSPRLVGHLINRIRNGTNGRKGTVSRAAADATGRMSSLSGAIASSFHNCRGNALIVDCSSSKANYYLLVFPPSCMVLYALQTSTCLDPTPVMSGLSTAHESAPECDARLIVEAIQKWNICQKQN